MEKGNEFYNRLMNYFCKKMIKKCMQHIMKENLLLLKDSLEPEKNKIYKYITLVLQNVHTDKLDDIVDKYNNTYHSTIKMKPADVKSSTYIDFSKGYKEKDSKFKNGDVVRVSKYKNIFARGYTPN